jgi:hypothetical protein
MICVYKITSPSKRVYIGSTNNFNKRISRYKNLDCKEQVRLYNSFLKYGVDKHKFEIVCECNLNDLRQKEAYYGNLFNCLGKYGLNCKIPKHGENYRCVSEETRERNRIASTGKTHSEETKIKMRGRKLTIEQIEKLVKSRKGKKHNEEAKLKMRKPRSEEGKTNMRGKLRSEEHRRKLSEANSGKNLSEETKRKLSKVLKNNSYALKHIILNNQTGVYYLGLSEAANSIGRDLSYVYDNLFRNNINNTDFILTK